MAFAQKQVHSIYATQRFRRHQVQNFFCFTVVRDPLNRLLGVYTNRVVRLRELHNCRKIKRRRVNLTADPDPDYFSKPVWLHCGVILGQTPSLADGRLYRR
ncbi:sulfotransferase family 2 domain-containing protein [Tateyamaria sp.]|uniref:sulfotransferase family 2 domain-containing protein n=1 Tax=Tateyamaria sp. TaxID=1929288 RepID=UPI0039B87FE8